MDGARGKLLDNILEVLGPAAAAQGLSVDRRPMLPGFNRTTAALRDGEGCPRLIVSVHGSDPAPGLGLEMPMPLPYLLTANSLRPSMELRIPGQVGGANAACLATARLPGTPYIPPVLRLPVPDAELRLEEVYAGVLDLAPVPRRLRVTIDLDLVSEGEIPLARLRRNLLHLVGSALHQGLLNEPGEIVSRLVFSLEDEKGPVGEPTVLVER